MLCYITPGLIQTRVFVFVLKAPAIDGAAFGSTFPHLFFLTFKNLDVSAEKRNVRKDIVGLAMPKEKEKDKNKGGGSGSTR